MTNAHTARDWLLQGTGRRRKGGRQAFRGGFDQRREGIRSSASIRPTCSNSGTGSAAATPWIRPSAFRPCWPSARKISAPCSTASTQMDEHFRTAPFERNLPVLMGLLAIWYNNFFGAQTVAVLPYEQYLKRFPAYLQQLTMESNGKHVTLDGSRGRLSDRPDLLGRAGHQRPALVLPVDPSGNRLIPCDFIAFEQPLNPLGRHHDMLLANVFARPRRWPSARRANR